MAGYTLEIGSGTDLVTLDANVSFRYHFEAIPSGNNTGDEVQLTIEARGSVNLTSASLIRDQIVAFAALVRNSIEARAVVTKLDGTEDDDLSFDPSDCIDGPVVNSFEFSTGDPGGGESHMRWAMTIFAKLTGRDGQENENTIGLKTSLAIKTVNDEIVRKTWRANATSGTADAAAVAVESYLPKDAGLTKEVERFFQDARAAGVAIWEAQKEKGVLSYEETVEFINNGPGYEEQTQVGDPGATPPPAVIHEKPRRAPRCVIRWKIKAFESPIEPPPPHFTADGATIYRDSESERPGDTVPAADFLKSGIYERSGEEIWISTEGFGDSAGGGGERTPDHSGHLGFTPLSPPADGVIADE